MSKAFPSFGPGQKDITGGRVLLLFLLLAFSLYQFKTLGIVSLGIGVVLLVIPIVLYLGFRFQEYFFWFLFTVNYFVMGLNRYGYIPVPITLITQGIEFLLLACIIIDQQRYSAKYICNGMCILLLVWVGYIVLQVLNNTSNLPFDFAQWFQRANQFSINIFLLFIIVGMIATSPEKIMRFMRLWACFTIAAAFWAFRQKTFGWDATEWMWLMQVGAPTHLIGGSIRYFSFFTDAANFGCNMGSSSMVFLAVALTTSIKRDKLLFVIAAAAGLYGVFISGTRTALACFMAAGACYVILSKSMKIAIPVGILGGIFVFILAFTNIGEGNMQVRRMRTMFNKDDASMNLRDINKAALRKYMKDAPFGLGITMDPLKVPANNKFKIVTTIASDSTYVYFWEYLGIVGVIIFAGVNILILVGGSLITMFNLHNKAMAGIGAGICSSFLAINVGGYANNILIQYPNIMLFYGGMAIVYLLPLIETEWEAYEAKMIADQEERERIKLEKKRASRV